MVAFLISMAILIGPFGTLSSKIWAQGTPTAQVSEVDAAFFHRGENVSYFFKGNQYFRLTGTEVDPGYPKTLPGEWKGLPASFHSGIDAAVQDPNSNGIYFFKGNAYSAFNPATKTAYPGYDNVTLPGGWQGLPAYFHSGIDAALDDNGSVILYKGNRQAVITNEKFVSESAVPAGLLASGPLSAAFKYSNGRNYFFSGSKVARATGFVVDSGWPYPIKDTWKGVRASGQEVATGDITITSYDGNCPAGQFDALPTVAEIRCVPQVYFHQVYLPFATSQWDAMVIARERYWVLANPDEVQASITAGKLSTGGPGWAADGNYVSPASDGTLTLNPKYSLNPDGFYYVLETAAKRVQAIPHRVNYGRGVLIPVDGLLPSAYQWQATPRLIPGNYWSSDWRDQHPAKALFGLLDAVLLRRAAQKMLRTKGMSARAGDVEDLLNLIITDPKARYTFAIYLVGEAYEALSTPRPTPEQLNFRKIFEARLSYERYAMAGNTYDSWREYNGQNPFTVRSGNSYAAPAANFLPKIPDASGFLSTLNNRNPTGIPSSGAVAIRDLIEPAILAGTLGDSRLSNDRYGLDMANVGVAAGFGGTIATAAGSFALVAGAVTTVGGSVTAIPIATSAVTAAMTVTQTVPGISYVVPNAGFLVSKGVLSATSSASLGGSAAIGVLIALALAALLSKSFADLAIAQALDRDLRAKVDAGPQPVDVYQMLSTPDAAQAKTNRASIFLSVLNMLIAGPVDRGLLTIERPPIPEIILPEGEFPPVPGYVRLQNNWYKTSYVNIEQGGVAIGEIQPNWLRGMWKKVPTIDGFFLLQSAGKTNEYLHIQNGTLQVGPIPGGEPWWSAQWREVPANDGWVRIQNRWKPNLYLNNMRDRVDAVEIQPNWASALWKVK